MLYINCFIRSEIFLLLFNKLLQVLSQKNSIFILIWQCWFSSDLSWPHLKKLIKKLIYNIYFYISTPFIYKKIQFENLPSGYNCHIPPPPPTTTNHRFQGSMSQKWYFPTTVATIRCTGCSLIIDYPKLNRVKS